MKNIFVLYNLFLLQWWINLHWSIIFVLLFPFWYYINIIISDKFSFALIQMVSFALIQKFSLCCQIFIIIYTSNILNIPIVFTVNMCFLGKDRTLSLFKHFDIDWAITIVKKFVVISKSLEISLIPLSGISLWCIIY